jgi:hypothetical protein
MSRERLSVCSTATQGSVRGGLGREEQLLLSRTCRALAVPEWHSAAEPGLSSPEAGGPWVCLSGTAGT